MRISKQFQSGEKFGRLTVIKLDHIHEYISPKKKQKQKYYLCKCDCGNECVILQGHLITAHTISCGCYMKEQILKASTTHKLTGTRLFNIFYNMKQRCYNKNNPDYRHYGYRGITICEKWLDKKDGFINFYNWSISNGYQDNLTIDRIDNNKGYSPDNCRWATQKQQVRNQRTNHIITYNGETHCVAEWADIIGIEKGTLSMRLNRSKWSIEKSITTKLLNSSSK